MAKNSFSMILRLEILLLVVIYEWKNIISYEKNVKFTKNNTLNDVFCNIIFLPIFLKMIRFS